jgi:hypothetical protein
VRRSDTFAGRTAPVKSMLLGVLLATGLNGAQAACAAGAKTVFACPTTNGKFVEVCDAGATFTYRFGKPGAAPELALTLPRERASTTQWGGAGSSISYSVEIPNGKTIYSVFTSMDRLGSRHDFVAGISVHVEGQQVAMVKCTGKNVVHDLEGIALKPTTW